MKPSHRAADKAAGHHGGHEVAVGPSFDQHIDEGPLMMDPRDLPTEVAHRRERLLRYARRRQPRERQPWRRLLTELARRAALRIASFEASPRRRIVGRALLGGSAVVALLAAVGALGSLPGTGSETVLIDAWRALGLAVFGGLFALVARDPIGYPGVLELAIAHKLGVALTASIWRDAPDAILVLTVDGALAAVLVVAYILLRADRAWTSAANRPSLGQRDAAASGSVRPRAVTSRELSHDTGPQRHNGPSPSTDPHRSNATTSRSS